MDNPTHPTAFRWRSSAEVQARPETRPREGAHERRRDRAPSSDRYDRLDPYRNAAEEPERRDVRRGLSRCTRR